MKVDIIIPIYNAFDYLVSCVISIYKQTDEKDFNLVLINDCSPDKRITEYLHEVKRKCSNIIVYENETNLGFVGTVNKGMKNTENDVILLNSDTEVTPDWLNKIKKAAYSKKEVATVTPLTNSGTICSVPNFCEDNEIPRTYSDYLEFSEMIDKMKIAKYPEAPTGVGFCMYIKREMIHEIGYFNEEKFGKGYGEENDFCCRCREHGYINIIDDCTFVYHKGSMSFESAKDSYIEKNLKVLSELYPYYNRDVAHFCEINPLKEIQDCIKLKVTLNEKKENILFVLHNDFVIGRNHPYGGTEMHVKDIVDYMKYKANCFVMSTHDKYIMVDIYYDDKMSTLQFPLDKSVSLTDYYRTDYNEIVSAFIKFFQVGLIHIHHFKGHTFDLIDIAKQFHIPIYYTVHDYFSICPNINLLYDDHIYCKFIKSDNNCNKCVKNKHQFNDIIDNWRSKFYENMIKCNEIITPSISAKNILIENYTSFGYDTSKLDITVIDHGEFEKKDIKKIQCIENHGKRLSIIVFGGIIKHKGSEMIYKLLLECDDYDWYVFGNIYEEKIKNIKKSNVYIRGNYKKEDIFDIITDIKPDITLTLPIWPETFSYVLSESYAAGVPIIGTKLGALEDRIIEGQTGWHVSFPLDFDQIIQKLKYIDTNRDKLFEVKQNLLKQPLKFVSMMNKEYEELYACNLVKNVDITTTLVENKIIVSGFLGGFDTSEEKEKNNIELIKIKEKLEIEQDKYDNLIIEHSNLLNHVQEINSSSTWRMLVFINTHLGALKKLVSSCVRFINNLFKK